MGGTIVAGTSARSPGEGLRTWRLPRPRCLTTRVSEFYVGAFDETDFVCLGVLADGGGEGFTDGWDTGAGGGRGLHFASDQFFQPAFLAGFVVLCCDRGDF